MPGGRAPLCGGASHEAEGRPGARGGGAGRVRPPTGWHRLRLLRQIGDELVPGVEQFLLVDDVIAVEDGAALVPGQEHGDALGDVSANQVASGGAAAIVKKAGRHPSRLAGGAPRCAPAPDGDAVAVEDQWAAGVAACPPSRQGLGDGRPDGEDASHQRLREPWREPNHAAGLVDFVPGEAEEFLLAPAGVVGEVEDVLPRGGQVGADGRGIRGARCLGAQLAISVNNCPPPRDPRSRMTSFKRTQRKYVQKAYRVRNWREYETGLRARGSLTVWLGLTDGKLANWNSPRPTRRKPGRQRQYSNHAIETTVTLGLVCGLASRQTEGFLRSLLTLLNLDNDVPDHSTISRRQARLGKVASYERRTVKPVHLRIDSSGLSVHVGQLRTPPKARDSRKLHLAVDEQTSDVVACELTSKRARDASRVASLVGQIERPIASAKADAAYDTGDVDKTLEHHRAHRSPKVLIPPRKGAQLALDSAGTRQRNRNIRAQSHVGKRKWYVASGYSRRSKVETTFHRYKAILGSAMRARGLASQRVEVRLGCKILNTMTALGIPDGEMIG